MKKNFTVKTVVATGIGAALFFVLGRFVAIPSPVPNTTVSIQYGLLAFMAAAFGPVAGPHRLHRPCPDRLQLGLGRMVELGHRLGRVRPDHGTHEQ